MNIYGPGVYTFNVGCPAGDPACTTASISMRYELTVPNGYLGAHMLFDWSTTTNTNIVQLWKLNTSWNDPSTGTDGGTVSQFCAAPLTTGSCNTNPNPNGNTGNTVWSAVSIDTPNTTIRNSDGSISTGGTSPDETNTYHGTKLIDGPMEGKSFNFNIQGLTAPVPLPAAAWLFGSGLAGLLGVARRAKRT